MSFFEQAWYNKAGWLILLWPFSLLFQLISFLRRRLQQRTSRPSNRKAPVVIIGNITVGGTGKTPLLITLVNHYKEAGFHPGIVSRGYGAAATSFPLQVDDDTPVTECGDEAMLIFQHTQCPVVIAPDREAAVTQLLDNNNVDLVFSDDGLQHYKMYRDIEVAVVDGQRLFGNGLCLPAGPLRESPGRLQEVDLVVINGEPAQPVPHLHHAHDMRMVPRYLVNMVSGERRPIAGAPFSMGNTVQAVAALGNPERFFKQLENLPYQVKRFSFPDHYSFSESDFDSGKLDPQQPIVMTEKDAVKCESFARPNFWSLSVAVEVPVEFLESLSGLIKSAQASIAEAGDVNI